MALPDLITSSYAAAGLAAYPFTAAQLAFVPSAITAASNEIRRWCMDRDFTQMTYTGEIYQVTLNGYVRLNQIPVNQIIRVQAQLQTAITISNDAALSSQVLFAYTGDVTDGQTVTGLTLNWVSNGTPSTTTLNFTANETIATLATAINGVGSGWNAEADSQLGAWPVTELYNGFIAVGTSQNATGQTALQVFSQDVADACFHPDDGQKTGLVWTGEQYSGLGPRWGPYPLDWDYVSNTPALVKITYNAGFATIPAIVQLATVEGVRIILQRMRYNPYLESFTAGEVSYTIAKTMMQAMPPYILQELSQYRLSNA